MKIISQNKSLKGKNEGGKYENNRLYYLADLFKMFADSTRIRILNELLDKELCVCDLANNLGLGQSAISHQLRLLRNAFLVKVRRDGKLAYYSLADDHVKSIFKQGLDHVEERMWIWWNFLSTH